MNLTHNQRELIRQIQARLPEFDEPRLRTILGFLEYLQENYKQERENGENE